MLARFVRMGFLLKFFLSTYIALWYSGGTATAQDPTREWAALSMTTPRSYHCKKVASKIAVDGKLEEADWQIASWTEPFVDIEGDIKPKPKWETRAKMLWDDEFFYIAATLKEPHVWGDIRKHDEVIFNNNDFEVFIDPDSDNHHYFEMEMNVLNATWDLLLVKPYKDGGPAENSLELKGMKTAVSIDGTLNDPKDIDRGWSVEIAIPWSAFAPYNAPPKLGDSWRVDFSRVEWQHEIVDGKYQRVPKTKEDNWVWSPTGIIDMHRPERWGWVCFEEAKELEGVSNEEKEARDFLHEIYYHQRAYREKNQAWATDGLTKLELSPEKLKQFEGRWSLQVTEEGFQASVDLMNQDRLAIQQDSRITIHRSPNLRR